jgi:hypothetical protein
MHRSKLRRYSIVSSAMANSDGLSIDRKPNGVYQFKRFWPRHLNTVTSDEVVLAVHVVRCQREESLPRQPTACLHEAERNLAARHHLQKVERVRLGLAPRHVLEQMHPLHLAESSS